MKKIISFINIIILIITFTACTGDEINQDCYECIATATTYCIDEGNDFYTVFVAENATETVSLNGNFWSDVKAELEANCGVIPPTPDCFTCTFSDTEYCYIEGAGFFTVTVGTADSTEVSLNGSTWETLKAGFQEDCTDCYFCDTLYTMHCYTQDADFYTTTVNLMDTQYSLNGQDWSAVKQHLTEYCPEEITASIVGEWKLSTYQTEHKTTITTTDEDVQTHITTITQLGSNFETALKTFTESPDEYTATGIFNNHIATTITDVDPTSEDVEVDFTANGTWQITDYILTTVESGVTDNFNILTLNDTTLKLGVYSNATSTDSITGTTTNVMSNATYIYTRQ